MSMHRTSSLSETGASGNSGGKVRGKGRNKGRSSDSRETLALLGLLAEEMKWGERPSLALLSGLSEDQMDRQLSGEARGLHDVVMTHLARMPRETAAQALLDDLDAHRRRVLPELSDTRTLDLFGRLNGGSR